MYLFLLISCFIFFYYLLYIYWIKQLLLSFSYLIVSFLLLFYWLSLIPIPFFSGFVNYIFITDNGNIGFHLLIIVLFPIIYWVCTFESKTIKLLVFTLILVLLLIIIFLIYSYFNYIIIYELSSLILVIKFLLSLFSYYRIRTSLYYYCISLFGNLFYLIGLILLLFTLFIYILFISIPFLIKIPCFPFYYWLPEVHCEANTSISLLLAGLLLKLSLFGLVRLLISSFINVIRLLCNYYINSTLIGLSFISFSFYRFIDLKKIIAFSSIIHLNIILIAISSLNSIGLLSLFFILLSHSLSSIGLFFIIGYIIDRTYSRCIDSFYFVFIIIMVLFLCILLINLNFPGSFNFITELTTLTAIYSICIYIILVLLTLSFLESFILFIILNKKIPFHSYFSLFISLYFFNIIIIGLSYGLGFTVITI